MPKSSWMSPSRQPRSVVTCPMSAHQNTKNVKLLSAMKITWITKALRKATVALTLVAPSARGNEKGSAAIDRHPRYGAPEDPGHRECRDSGPENQTSRQCSRCHEIGSQYE